MPHPPLTLALIGHCPAWQVPQSRYTWIQTPHQRHVTNQRAYPSTGSIKSMRTSSVTRHLVSLSVCPTRNQSPGATTWLLLGNMMDHPAGLSTYHPLTNSVNAKPSPPNLHPTWRDAFQRRVLVLRRRLQSSLQRHSLRVRAQGTLCR